MGFFFSSNNGLSWSSVSSGLPNILAEAYLAISDTNIFLGGDSIYVSTNNGKNWSKIISQYNLTSIEAIIADSKNVYVGTRYNGVFRLTKSGTYWTTIDLGLNDKTVYSIAKYDSTIFVGTADDGLFLSTDNGKEWQTSGLTTHGIISLAMVGSCLFAGTYDGIYVSTDYGISWKSIISGLPTTNYYGTKSIVNNNSYVYLGSNGVWRRALSDITDVNGPNNVIPIFFSVSQNYPNPFNPSTEISYQVLKTSHVQLKVYDLLGREVAILVDKEESPGSYQVKFDIGKATNHLQLSTGIYIYRLTAGNFSESKKMILLK